MGKINDVDSFLIGLYIYADKSKLSSFGSVTGYPVIIRLAILPHLIRNAKGMGGGCLIGWLPEVSLHHCIIFFNSLDVIIGKIKGNETDKCNGKWSEFQSLAYQQAMGEILSLLRHPVHWGLQIQCADGILRQVYPFILGLIADNQERYVTLLIPVYLRLIPFLSWAMLVMHGANALKPCAICHIPRDALHRLNVKHPQCSKLELHQIIQKAQMMGRGPAEDLLWNYGLCAHLVCVYK